MHEGNEYDANQYNQFLAAHETAHYSQQIKLGFGHFYARTISQYVRLGFTSVYDQFGSLEMMADWGAYMIVGTPWKIIK